MIGMHNSTHAMLCDTMHEIACLDMFDLLVCRADVVFQMPQLCNHWQGSAALAGHECEYTRRLIHRVLVTASRVSHKCPCAFGNLCDISMSQCIIAECMLGRAYLKDWAHENEKGCESSS